MLVDTIQYDVALKIASYYKNDDVACAYIGLIYREGWGVKRDLSCAESMLKKAADTNCRFLYDYVKVLILRNTPESIQSAKSFVQLGVRWGLTKSYLQLGIMYRYGIGVTKSYSDAVIWISKACTKEPWFYNTLIDLMYLEGNADDLRTALKICKDNIKTEGLEKKIPLIEKKLLYECKIPRM